MPCCWGCAPAEGVAQQARDKVERLDQRVEAHVHAAAVRDAQLALRTHEQRSSVTESIKNCPVHDTCTSAKKRHIAVTLQICI